MRTEGTMRVERGGHTDLLRNAQRVLLRSLRETISLVRCLFWHGEDVEIELAF